MKRGDRKWGRREPPQACDRHPSARHDFDDQDADVIDPTAAETESDDD